MIRVFHDHNLLDEFPAYYNFRIVDEGLEIRHEDTVVKRYERGMWHGAGTNIACAFVEDKLDCQTCHPPST